MTTLSNTICTLRPVSPDDIARSLEWRNDELVKKNLLSFRLPITKPMEEAWIAKAMNGDTDRIVFSIEDKEAVHVLEMQLQ